MNWKDEFPQENRYLETDNGILYNAEATQTMSKFPEKIFDAVITDPPYGTTKCKWDTVIPFDKMWRELKRIRKDRTPIVLFGSEPFSSYLRLSNIKEYKYDLVWQKQKPVNFFHLKRQFGKVTEYVHLFYKKQCKYNPQMTIIKNAKIGQKSGITKKSFNSITSGTSTNYKIRPYIEKGTRYPINILKFNRVDESKYVHPTQKPLALLEYLVKTYTDEGDLVLDFTCGSGTTAMACEKLNRRWVGIELEEKYCGISKERILGVKI